MFTVTAKEIDTVLRDFGIAEHCAGISELQRYHYEENDPASKEVRLIVKVRTESGRALVVRFKNEADVTLALIEEQSRFAAFLRENGIETPRLHASGAAYARPYRIGGYEVIVTVEDFVSGQLREVDAAAAEETGRLLARMHNIAEAGDRHVKNEVLFHPLRPNELFSFEDFAAREAYLSALDAAMYDGIVRGHARLLRELGALADEPAYAVQGDISDCNLYRTPDGTLGVFDFNRCGDNVLFYDAAMQAIFEARLMAYSAALAGDPEPVILPAFWKGYRRERPLTERQRAVWPALYALVTAFWSGDVLWGKQSLLSAVDRDDPAAALAWMREIARRLDAPPPAETC